MQLGLNKHLQPHEITSYKHKINTANRQIQRRKYNILGGGYRFNDDKSK